MYTWLFFKCQVFYCFTYDPMTKAEREKYASKFYWYSDIDCKLGRECSCCSSRTVAIVAIATKQLNSRTSLRRCQQRRSKQRPNGRFTKIYGAIWTKPTILTYPIPIALNPHLSTTRALNPTIPRNNNDHKWVINPKSKSRFFETRTPFSTQHAIEIVHVKWISVTTKY